MCITLIISGITTKITRPDSVPYQFEYQFRTLGTSRPVGLEARGALEGVTKFSGNNSALVAQELDNVKKEEYKINQQVKCYNS